MTQVSLDNDGALTEKKNSCALDVPIVSINAVSELNKKCLAHKKVVNMCTKVVNKLEDDIVGGSTTSPETYKRRP